MVLCCCNWSGVAKLRYIAIHDYVFTALTMLGILSSIANKNIGGIVVFLLHLILVNVPRLVAGILLMRSGYIMLWAKRCLWTRLITLVIQIILDIVIIIGSGLQAGRDPKRGVPSLIIVLICIIIVVGFDIYYAKVIKNYIDTPQNVTPQNYYIENPAQVVYAQNGLNPPNHVTYLQGNNVAQSYTPYQGGVHTGVPVPHQNPTPSHQQEYPVLPPINRNKEMEIELGRGFNSPGY